MTSLPANNPHKIPARRVRRDGFLAFVLVMLPALLLLVAPERVEAQSMVSAADDALEIVEQRTGNVAFDVIAGTGFGATGGMDTGEGLAVTRYWAGRNTAGRSVPVPTLFEGNLGKLQILASGAGRFDLGEGDPLINGLDVGEELEIVFTYEVMNTAGMTDTATLTITVTGVNDPPVAQGDRGRVSEDGPNLEVDAPGVLANDTDPEGDATSFTVTRYARGTTLQGSGAMAGTALPTPGFGTLTLNANGSYTFDPDEKDNNFLRAGRTRVEPYTYEVSDGATPNPLVLTARLTITVIGANDAPEVAVLTSVGSVTEDSISSATGDSNVFDADEGDNAWMQARFDGGPWVGDLSDEQSVSGNYGTLTVFADDDGDGNGGWRYTLDNASAATNALAAGDSEEEFFNFRGWDGRSAHGPLSVRITVNGANDVPVAVSPLPTVRTAVVGSAYSYDLNNLFEDPEGNDLTFTVTTGTCAGFVVSSDNLVGSDSGNLPDDATAGDVSCTIAARDGITVAIRSIMFSVTVFDSPPALAAVNDAASGTEDDPTITGNVTDDSSGGQDTAPSGAPTVTRYEAGSSLTGAAVNAPASAPGTHGSLTITTAGIFTYTVAASNNALASGASNTDTFTYEIADGTASRETATLTITIAGVNDAPVAVSPPPPIRTAVAGSAYSYDLNNLFEDPDGDDLTLFSLVEGSCAGFAVSGDNLVGSDTGGIVPAATTAGDVNCRVATTDGMVSVGVTARFVVGVFDIPPALAVMNDAESGTEDETTITGNVVDGSSGGRDTSPTATLMVTRYASGSSLAGAVSAPASAPGTHGRLTIATTGAFTYTVAASNNALTTSASNTDTFTYEITDGTASRETATLTITITGVNDAPVAQDPPPTIRTARVGTMYELDLNTLVTDAEGDDLAFTLVGACDGLAISGDNLVGSDTGGVVPAATTVGDKNCSVRVSDGTGMSTVAFTVPVRASALIVSAADDALEIVEQRTGNVAFDVIAGTGFGDTGGMDTGEGLVVTRYWAGASTAGRAVPVPTLFEGNLGKLQILASGAGRFDLGEGDPLINGLDVGEELEIVFTYEVMDTAGMTDTATLTITVTGVNDPPVAQGDRGRVSEDGPNLVVAAPGVLANDTDPEGDATSLTVTRYAIGTTLQGSGAMAGTALPTPGFGTLTLNANGSYTFDPAEAIHNFLRAGQTQFGSYTYEVSDGATPNPLLLTARLTITVIGANDAPVIINLSRGGSVTEAGAAAGTPRVTAQAAVSSDPDADDNHRIQVRFDGGPWVGDLSDEQSVSGTYGDLTLGLRDWDYVLDNARDATNALAAGDTEQDLFEARAWDGTAASATVTITITVNGANDAPVAVSPLPTVRTAVVGSAYSYDLNNLLEDPEGDDLVFLVAGAGTCAGFIIDGDNLVGSDTGGVVPAATTAGNVSCHMGASDGTAIGTVMFSVAVFDSAPALAAANDTVSGTEDEATITGNVTDGSSGGRDTAPSGAPMVTRYEAGSSLTGAAVNAPASAPGTHGSLTITTAGVFTYTVAASNNALASGASNTDTFTYEITGGTASRETATLTITVTGVNDAPVQVSPLPAFRTAFRGTMYSFDLNRLATDADNDDLTFTQVAGTCQGLTISGDNLVGSGAGGTVSAGTLKGTVGCGVTASDGTGMVTISSSVRIADRLPELFAADDAKSVTEDGATITGNVIDGTSGGQDTAPSGTPTVTRYEEGSRLSVTGAAVNAPASAPGAHGSLTITTAGAFTYTVADSNNALAAGRSNTDTFTYEIADGTASRDMATLTITITGVNDAPVARSPLPPIRTANVGTMYELDLNTLVTDTDGDDLAFTLVGACDGFAISGDNLVGSGTGGVVPAATTVGDKNCSVRVSDGRGMSTVAFTVPVRASALIVSAADDALEIVEQRTGNVAFNVIAGTGFGTTGGMDTGEGLVVTRYWAGASTAGRAAPVPTLFEGNLGKLQILASGAGRFDLGEGDPLINGLDVGEELEIVFTYEVMDTAGMTDTATLTITVTGVNDPPVAQGDRGRVSEDGPNLVVAAPGVLANDTDPEGDPTSFSVTRYAIGTTLQEGAGTITMAGTALPTSGKTSDFGTLTLNANGSYTFEPNKAIHNFLRVGQTRVGSYTYEVSDGATPNPLLLTARLTITVIGANDAPVISNLSRGGSVTEAGAAAGTPRVATQAAVSNDPDADDNDRIQVRFDGGPWVGDLSGPQSVSGTYGDLTLELKEWNYVLDNDRDATNALAAGDTEQDLFEARAWDGTAASATVTITITVNGANDAPVAVSPLPTVRTAVVGSAYSYDLNNLFEDPEGDDLTTFTVSTGTCAGFAISGDNLVGSDTGGVVPAATTAGDVSCTIVASDGTVTGTVMFSVTVFDSAPALAAANDTVSGTEDEATITGNVTDGTSGGRDTAPSGAPMVTRYEAGSSLTGAAVNAPASAPGTHGSLTITTAGVFTYTVAASNNALASGASNTDTFTYEIADGTTSRETATLTITIAGANDAPVAVSPLPPIRTAVAGSAYSYDLNNLFEDPDGDDLVFTRTFCAGFSVSGDNLVGNDTGGIVPETTRAGEVFCTIAASDGTAGGAEARFSVGVFDSPPELAAANDTASGTEDETTITGNVTDGSSGGRDASPTATLMVTRYASGSSLAGAVSAPASAPGTHGRLTIATTTGAFTYTVAASNNALTTGENNTDTFTYEITDGTASRETATLTITITGVNDAPVAQDPPPTIRTAIVGTMYELDLNTLVTDAEGDDLTFTLVGTCAGFTVSGDNLVGSDTGGVVPMATTAGNKACSVTASDGTSMPTIAFTVPVTDIPPALTAVNDTESGTEDEATITGNVIDGSSGGRDTSPTATPTVVRYAAGSSLAGAVNAPASAPGTHGRLTIATTGALTYTVADSNNALASGRSNTDTFTYEITDGTASRETATLTITITGVNDAPEARSPPPTIRTAFVGTMYELDLNTLVTDAEGDDLTFTLVGTCAGFTVSGDNLVGSDTGGVVPMATTVGNKNCSVTASDGTSMPTIAFTVPVAEILAAMNDAKSGTEAEATITGNVIDGSSGGRDTAPSGAPTVTRYAAGSSLVGAVNAPASAPGTHGRLTIATTGAFTYTVAASNDALTTGENNTDTFTYEITDGTASRETATLTITITGINNAPVQVSSPPPIRTALVGTMYELDLNTLVTDAEGDDSDVHAGGNL